MFKPFVQVLLGLIVVIGVFGVSGETGYVRTVSAAEVTTPVERTPAFYQALGDIYNKLVMIQVLVNELMLEEAAALNNIAVATPYGVISGVLINVDYATGVSTADIQYREGLKQTSSVPSVVPKEIVAALAEKIGINQKQLTPLLHYRYQNGDILKKIVVTLKNSRTISITQVYADTTTKQQVVPGTDIDELIADNFFGMTSVYQAFYDDYLAKVKKGEKPTEVVSFVATILNLQPEAVSPIIEFAY